VDLFFQKIKIVKICLTLYLSSKAWKTQKLSVEKIQQKYKNKGKPLKKYCLFLIL
jgi:hypothetical protein